MRIVGFEENKDINAVSLCDECKIKKPDVVIMLGSKSRPRVLYLCKSCAIKLHVSLDLYFEGE